MQQSSLLEYRLKHEKGFSL